MHEQFAYTCLHVALFYLKFKFQSKNSHDKMFEGLLPDITHVTDQEQGLFSFGESGC